MESGEEEKSEVHIFEGNEGLTDSAVTVSMWHHVRGRVKDTSSRSQPALANGETSS